MKSIILSFGIMVMALALIAPTASAAAAGGPNNPAGGAAVVSSGAYTEIVSADGAKVSGLRVTLSPGEHTIAMKPSYPVDNSNYTGGYFLYSNVNGSVTFNAEPGHQYVAYVTTRTQRTKEDELGYTGSSTDENAGTGFTWVGYIEDKTAHQKVAKTESLRLEAYPRPLTGYGGSFMSHR